MLGLIETYRVVIALKRAGAGANLADFAGILMVAPVCGFRR